MDKDEDGGVALAWTRMWALGGFAAHAQDDDHDGVQDADDLDSMLVMLTSSVKEPKAKARRSGERSPEPSCLKRSRNTHDKKLLPLPLPRSPNCAWSELQSCK